MSPYRQLGRLWPFVRLYRRWLAAAVLALAGASACVLALPRAVAGFITAAITPTASAGTAELGFLLILALGYAAALALRIYATGRVAEGGGAALRARAHAHLIGLPPGVFEKHPFGDLLSRLTTDVAVVQAAIGGLVLVALRGAIQFCGAVAVMAVSQPILTIAALAAAPVIFAAMASLGAVVRRLARRTQDLQGDTLAAIEETLAGVQVVQAFGREDDERRRVDGLTGATLDAARRRDAGRASMTFIAVAIIFAAVLAVVWIGAREVRLGTMSGADLLQFVLYSILAAQAAAALSDIHAEAAQAVAAAQRVLAVLDEPAAEPAATAVPRLLSRGRGEVVFDHVSFAYPGRPDSPVLHDVCLTVAAGEKVALVGPSGSGKSTLFRLLLRFDEPSSGRILIDGTDIRSVDPCDVRRRLAWVPQEPTLFTGSVFDNLRFGRSGATLEEAVEAARSALLHDFLMQLPQGYDTLIGAKGSQLSGGQRQRLAIGRALLRDASILLLDEATAFLDAENEQAFHRHLVAAAEGRTVLMSTHRLSTARVADRTVVLDGGRIVGIGAHGQLAAQCPEYGRLIAAGDDPARPRHDRN